MRSCPLTWAASAKVARHPGRSGRHIRSASYRGAGSRGLALSDGLYGRWETVAAIRAVFFDLDDTLCDSAAAWPIGLGAAFDALRQRHPEIQRETLAAAWDAATGPLIALLEAGRVSAAHVRGQRFRHTLRELGVGDDRLADQLDGMLARVYLDHLRVFDDVSVLDHLRPRYHVGIITNGAADDHLDSQRTKAECLGLLSRVDSFLASDEIGSRKPQPRIFAHALSGAGVQPRDAVYVGDSPVNDVAGANRAGMWSILLWRTSRPVPSLSGEQVPDHVITRLDDLPRVIEQIEAERP